MKKGIAVLFTLCALAFVGCNNYFHDLIPPDGNRIISFSVEGQSDRAEISDDTITAIVGNESPIYSLIPEITISPKATLLPLTYDYLNMAFPDADILKERTAVYEASDITEYVIDLIKRTPGFNVPALDMPIDFTGPVTFLVVSGQGNIRQYTVHVVMDSGEPRLLGLGFSKYDNPELIRDAFTLVNENAKTIQAAALYPVEMDISYALIPSFQILGDKLEIDGIEVRSGVDTVQFDMIIAPQSKTVTVWRNGLAVNYTLTVLFSEDIDSIRSIIDFRFNKAENPGIAVTAVGSIYNSNNLGTINVQVFYSGARPSYLTARFLSPGTVTVAGVTQSGGVSSQDFSQILTYRVVSRNGLYVRIYTVRVDYIDIFSAAPSFTSFKFSSALNPELVQDAQAQISESGGGTAGLIMLSARYSGSRAPEGLIPEFRATGLVTVFGSVQTSGFSAQNFSRQIKYTVTNPENPLLTRDYWVQVNFIRDTSSDASINSFSFHPDENPGLAGELTGHIDSAAGTIAIFAPIGSGVTGRTMFPRFRAAGQVLVNGDAQISGTSGRLFDAPVVYEVVSANGLNRRQYTVTVRELQSTIYVNQNAFGIGDGTNWHDAFHSLKDACEAAAQFPTDVPKEIWIAAGTYKPSSTGNSEEYFPFIANTSYIGGFAGYETSKSQRNIAANKVIISGDLGGGKYSCNLFGSFYGNQNSTVNGDLSFDGLEFTAARATGSGARFRGAAILAQLSNGFEINIRNCAFNNLQAEGSPAVVVLTGKLIISDTVIENSQSQYNSEAIFVASVSAGIEISDIKLRNITGGGIYFSYCDGDIKINGAELQDISGNGISFDYHNADIKINDVDLQNISGEGIYIRGGIGRRDLSRITGKYIGSNPVKVFRGLGDVTLSDSSFDRSGTVYIYNHGNSNYTNVAVNISNTKITNVNPNNHGLSIMGNDISLERVTVENVSGARGININQDESNNTSLLNPEGNIWISECSIKNARGSELCGGLGIFDFLAGPVVINNSRFENCSTAGNGSGAIWAMIQYAEITNTDFINCSVNGYVMFIFGYGSTSSNGTNGYVTVSGCNFYP
jgi:hypothetical protein